MAIKKTKQIDFKLGLVSIKTTKFSMNEPQEEYNSEEKDITEFETTIDFSVNQETEQIKVDIITTLKIKETNEVFFELVNEIVYHINPIDAILLINKNEDGTNVVSILNEIIRTLFSISMGTVRGIVHEKLRGTRFNNEMIPLLDPNSFIEKLGNKKA